MKLSENEAHIWFLNVDDFSHDIELCTNYLSSEEIKKANQFKFERDRTVSILARYALRTLSGRYLDLEANRIDFEYGPQGKPGYGFPTALNFNVSHSGKIIALAFVKNSKIGVDVEYIKTDFDVLDIAENFFSPDEIKLLQKVPKNSLFEAFYRCWTRKESFIKAEGSGLSFPLASFTVSIDEDTAELLKTKWNLLEKEEWRLFTFKPRPSYVGALSVGASIQAVTYHNWNFTV